VGLEPPAIRIAGKSNNSATATINDFFIDDIIPSFRI
jgi:hypothetical protein